MDLKKQLQADLKDAMRKQEVYRKSALRMALTAIQYAEVGKSEELSDEDALAILSKEVRLREEALKLIEDVGRTDLIEKEAAELEVLKSYLPQQLTPEEIMKLAEVVISQVQATSISDLGSVMKYLMPQVKGKADGRTVNQVVKDLLSA